MSDEEKKAIKELTEIKELVEEDLKYEDYNVSATLDQIDLESLVIVLKLIEKQSKEIEEAEQKVKKAYIDGTNIADKLCNEKWERKIKAKIEEVQNMKAKAKDIVFKSSLNYIETELQSLLDKE